MTTVRDLVCGMSIDTKTALSAKIGNHRLFLRSHLQSNFLQISSKIRGQLSYVKRRLQLWP